MRHIIESQQFDRNTIEHIFKKADSRSRLKGTPLRGKIMASLFYEPSTRTRFSFESAMFRLGGEVITTENAAEFSSAAKGEALEDTIRVVQYYADIIVLRHPEQGASERAALVSEVPVINAGDGAGQHPTQALLDLYTIQKEVGKIDGAHVAMVGDLKHSRTARSLAYLLGKYKQITITFISPRSLRIGDDIKTYLGRHGVQWHEDEDWSAVLGVADVLYQTRLQKERFRSAQAYRKHVGAYVLTGKEVDAMKKSAVVLHPLPRVDEIAPGVDDSPKAAYFRQAKYGVLVRMALLEYLLT
jgi:aspartate carbamoyltransferase catalytic subunit